MKPKKPTPASTAKAAAEHKLQEARLLRSLRACVLIFEEVLTDDRFEITHPNHHALTALTLDYLKQEIETVEDNGDDLSFLVAACDVAQELGGILTRLNANGAAVIRHPDKLLPLVDSFADFSTWEI